jgi:hypothetical protein
MSVRGFTESDIQGWFALGYAAGLDQSIVPSLGGSIRTSTRAGELYGFSSPLPKTQAWPENRPRTLTGTEKRTILIPNTRFEAPAISIDDIDTTRDTVGEIRTTVFNYARVTTSEHWTDQVTALINTNGNAFDGLPFFSLAAGPHTLWMAGSGIINDVVAAQVPSLNIGTTTAPTPAEFAQALLDTIAYMKLWADRSGRLLHNDAMAFDVVVATAQLYAPLLAAVDNPTVLVGGNLIENPLRSLTSRGLRLTPRLLPGLTSATDKFCLFRTDAAMSAPSGSEVPWLGKPFIFQQERAFAPQTTLPSGDTFFMTKKLYVATDGWTGSGYGLFHGAARGTFS